MERSIFLSIRDEATVDGKMSALEREMLALNLQVNPELTLDEALTDVYEYLKKKTNRKQREKVAARLVRDHERQQKTAKVARPEEEDGDSQATRKAKSEFGAKWISWVQGLGLADKLLAACSYDVAMARRLYEEEDYLIADHVVDVWFHGKWQDSLISLEAACAPWSTPSRNSRGNVEEIDMTGAAENDSRWDELAAALAGR